MTKKKNLKRKSELPVVGEIVMTRTRSQKKKNVRADVDEMMTTRRKKNQFASPAKAVGKIQKVAPAQRAKAPERARTKAKTTKKRNLLVDQKRKQTLKTNVHMGTNSVLRSIARNIPNATLAKTGKSVTTKRRR